ncbi:MAG: TIGR01777 family oxidoreductase [Deltaproteobacteria bacterium]|nr:TIGR01777 family oxidoreductase [Deltaproteobacteria bacterium]MBW1968740.1 TIGR01777 family oxidoreductase [Deltaproteobacteria bacterium]MBW2155033.1 TIGR01777 family oxidoreductase [Deltaproteobacteria bacterium]MBW2324885.1 TIGR01777 family oxidoreductase [Deltaproteobacteria bacterium]MBW2556049.1 TIGR01777 family oxidoreductase [Deltaproteobacteria bacterium]
MKVFITGGSGFVGTHLIHDLIDRGHRVIAVGTSSAHKNPPNENFRYISADTTLKGPWQDALEDVDAIINLAGRNIFKLWSDTYKNQIYNSRILTTRNLVEAVPESKGIILCSTSGAGYYGNRADEVLTEDASSGSDFLAKVGIDWEKEAFLAEKKGVRVAAMRFGVVLDKNGGALAKMIPAFKYFAGGPLGSGLQWFPWIHMADLISAINFILETNEIKGPVNFCAPHPIKNRDFSKALGNVLNRPSFMKVPSFMIRLVVGEMGTLLTNSQKVIPHKLLRHGFKFQHPDIDSALEDIFK